MRLEHKMNKWLKLFIKCIPLFVVFYNIIAFIGSDLGPFFAMNLQDDIYLNVENWNSALYDVFYVSFTNLYESISLPMFLSDFNEYFISLFEVYGANGAEPILWALSLFEWFIFVDFMDLVFSAFRFIIDIAHSWLDGFYTRSKRGGK